MIKNWQKLIICIPIIILGIFVVANFVCAADLETGINYAATTGLGTQDIRVIIANIIRVALGLLGVVAIGLIIYGGAIWMTAQGMPEKIEKAKKILIGATIGLVIILSSLAIATFILNSILNATGGGGGGFTPCTEGQTQSCGSCGSQVCTSGGYYGPCVDPCGGLDYGYCEDPDKLSDAPYICSLSPTLGPKGTYVTIKGGKFSAYVDENTTKVYFNKSFGASSTNEVEATIALCNGNPAWDANNIVVEVPNLTDLGNYYVNVLTSNGESKSKSSLNGTNEKYELTDGEPGPGIACIDPNFGKENDPVDVYGKRFGTNGSLIFRQDKNANVNPWADEHLVSSVPGGAVTGDVYVQVGASKSNNVYFRVTCAVNNDCLSTCCQNGNCVPAENCYPGPGQSCDSNTVTPTCDPGNCQSGLICDPNQNCTCQSPGVGTPCDSNTTTPECDKDDTKCATDLYCSTISNCTCQYKPQIYKIDPNDGKPGNYVTIFGRGFGDTAGKVFFADNNVEGVVPTGCGSSDLWQDGQIIIEIPNGAIDGFVKVQTADNLEATSPSEFDINDVVRPSLCGVNPNTGIFGDSTSVSGKNFGSVQGKVQIGGTDFDGTPWSWADNLVQNLIVPNILPATLPVQVRVGGIYSNPFNFIVTQSATAPVIDHVTPTSGPTGKYITIFGSNFGNDTGTVYFKNTEPDENNWAKGDISFPQACLQSGFWHNSAITIKVPDAAIADSSIYIKTKAGQASNKVDFNHCANCPRGPDVCAISPSSGPIGTTDITIYGDNMGDTAGTVEFFDKVTASTTDNANKSWWTKNQIGTGDAMGATKGPIIVPAGAKTGNVTVIQGGLLSNPVLFSVSDCRQTKACAAGTTCCTDGACRAQCAEVTANNCTYLYSFTTGTLPGGPPQVVEDILCATNTQSPSPWKDSIGNCINAQISARFNMDMDPTTVNLDNVKVYKCNSGDNFSDSDCTTPVNATSIVYKSGKYFVFDPVGNLDANYWFKVILSGTGIKSATNIYLDGDYNNQAGGDYAWHFRTSDQECAVDHIVVTPGDKITLTSLTQKQDYNGNAFAANCNMLNANDYPWQWSYDKNGFANVFGEPVSLSPTNLPDTTATPLDQGEVFVVAEINPGTAESLIDSDNDLEVDLGKPQIEDVWPIDGIVRPEVNTKVTIYGKNFGMTQGGTKVLFGTTEATLADCANNWSDEMIMVNVPQEAFTNNGDIKPIKIITADKGESNDKYPTGHVLAGSTIQFTRDDSKVYPFLCSLIPNIGLKGEAVMATGENFGDSNLNIINKITYRLQSNVIFKGDFAGNIDQDVVLLLTDIKNWVNTRINLTVPSDSEQSDKEYAKVRVSISPKTEPFVDTNNNGLWASPEQYIDADNNGSYTNGPIFDSNELPFNFKPVITSITPDNGPKKTWITIFGYNFGNTAGKVGFAQGDTVVKEFNYDDIKPSSPCPNTWTNRQIIVVVPDDVALNLEQYNLYIKTARGIESNRDKTFTINANPLAPGLCGFSLTSTSSGTGLFAYGDRFGDQRLYDPAAYYDLVKSENVIFTNSKAAIINTIGNSCPAGISVPTVNTWCNRWIWNITPNNAVSGNVVVTKKILIGKKCIGPSFGGFCFSGQYADEYQLLPSNPVALNVSQPPIVCVVNCNGAQCTNDDDCRRDKSGVIDTSCFSKCVAGFCTPYIKNFNPLQGPLGSWVTVQGCHFGCPPGDVYFTGSDRTNDILKKDEKIFYNFNDNNSFFNYEPGVTGDGSGSDGTHNLSGSQYDGFLKGAATISGGVLDLTSTSPALLMTQSKIANEDFTTLPKYYVDWGGSNELTVSAWVTTAGKTGGIFIAAGGGNTGPYDYWKMYFDNNRIFQVFSNWFDFPKESHLVTAQTVVPASPSGWYNLTMVVIYKTGEDTTYIQGYANGQLVASSSVKGRALRTDLIRPLIVGGQAWYYPHWYRDVNGIGYSFFKGKIDDVRVYTRALNSGEVQQIFNYGNENYNNGVGYIKKSLLPENQNCTFWNCSANGLNDEVIVEVPNIREGSETNYSDDATTGPIEIITGDTKLVDTSTASTPAIPGEFISDYGVVQSAEMPPKICKLDPNKGNREKIIKVYGDNLHFPDEVNFIPDTLLDTIREPFEDKNTTGAYEAGENYIDINENKSYDSDLTKSLYTYPGNAGNVRLVYANELSGCPESVSDKQEKIACFAVPNDAAGEGTGELTAKDKVSITRGAFTSNALSFTTTFASGSTGPALKILQTVPYDGSTGFCRNGIIDIYFDSFVDVATINKDNFTVECTSATPTAKQEGFFSKGLSFVKNVIYRIGGFEQTALAQQATYTCPHVLTQDEYSLKYFNLNGATTVSIVPRDLLRAGTTYQVNISGGLNGVRGITGAQLDTTESPITLTDKYAFSFGSAGDPNADPMNEDNGICRINSIFVMVYSKEGTEGRLAEDNTDLFTCAGDNCKSEFDWDQSDVLSGNQHRYELIAKFSGGVTVKAKFSWLKSDTLDPKRALSFAALENAGADDLDQDADEYKFTNNTGTVYVTVAPVKETVPKLIIQAQAQGTTSNIYNQDFTVYVLLCKNPWPSLNEHSYPSEQINAYKFGTWYCRDAGDPDRTDDDLPAAKKIQSQICAPVCKPGQCAGEDGCGGNCGNGTCIGSIPCSEDLAEGEGRWYCKCFSSADCGAGLSCVDGLCQCVPSCSGKMCGVSNCAGVYCNNGVIVASPDLAECPYERQTCINNQCQCTQPFVCSEKYPNQCGNFDNGCGDTMPCDCGADTCVNGTCCVSNCTTAGEYSCENNILNQCRSVSGSACLQKAEVQVCGAKTCNAATGTCECVLTDPTCSAATLNTFRCINNKSEKCQINVLSGCPAWAMVDDCPAKGQNCTGGACTCIPKTCAQLGKECGSWSDGCSATPNLSCGTCPVNYTCSANGICTQSCIPTCTDGATGKQKCGGASDGCQSNMCNAACPTGPPAQTCYNQLCCTPSCTDSATGKQKCNGAFDSCGGTCTAACPSGQTCNTTTNLCEVCSESDADFCARKGASCGTISGTDLCGNTKTNVNCGSCASAPAPYQMLCSPLNTCMYVCMTSKDLARSTTYPKKFASVVNCPPAFNCQVYNDQPGWGYSQCWASTYGDSGCNKTAIPNFFTTYSHCGMFQTSATNNNYGYPKSYPTYPTTGSYTGSNLYSRTTTEFNNGDWGSPWETVNPNNPTGCILKFCPCGCNPTDGLDNCKTSGCTNPPGGCTPGANDCTGKCAPSKDTCNNNCPATCTSPQICVSGQCKTPKLVFVTKGYWYGKDIGGIAGADAKCQTEAGQAGKTGTFKAWISVGTDNPVSRFTAYTNVIFKLGNGSTFANSWNDVISGNLQNPIYWHADGSAVTINASDTAWTNTTPAGLTFFTVDNKTCKGFTGAGITGGARWWAEYGSIQYFGTNWTNWTSGECDNTSGGDEEQYRGRLYCFEQ